MALTVTDRTALERADLVVSGDRAELRVEDGHVTIDKQAPTRDAPTRVEFGIDRIRGTQLKAPSRGVRGWLHLSVVGGSPTPPGEFAAAGDPYTLLVTGRSVGAARRFAKLVDRHVRERGMPWELDPTEGRLSAGVSITDASAGAVDLPPTASEPSTGPSMPPPAEASTEPPAEPRTGPSTEGPTEPPVEASTEVSEHHVTSVPSDPAAFVAELRALADLHASGALSDEEYARAKARVLG